VQVFVNHWPIPKEWRGGKTGYSVLPPAKNYNGNIMVRIEESIENPNYYCNGRFLMTRPVILQVFTNLDE